MLLENDRKKKTKRQPDCQTNNSKTKSSSEETMTTNISVPKEFDNKEWILTGHYAGKF